MKNKLLKGFTILEALISLMLMSIIVVITYSLVNLVEKQLSLFDEDNTQFLAYNLFNTALMLDLNNANNFDINNKQLILINYDNTKVYYDINKEYILRKNTIETDTFKVKTIDYEFFNSDNSKPLNKIFKLTLNMMNDTINAHYFLNKNSSTLINTIYFNED